MAHRPKSVEYHEGSEAAWRAERALGTVLSVSKEELARREAAYEESQKGKPRRGPKPTKA
jgi:hypothetical protein